jgi:hypothetical protein
MYASEAEAAGRRVNVLHTVGSAIAEKVPNPAEWVDALVETGGDDQLVAPLLRRLHDEVPSTWLETCRNCWRKDTFRTVIVAQVLAYDGVAEDLMSEVLDALPAYAPLVHVLCLRGEVATTSVRRLLTHRDNSVAAAAAVGEWQRTPRGDVRPGVRDVWRSALLRCGPKQMHEVRSLFVRDVLSSDPDLAFDWLLARIRDGAPLYELEDYDLEGAIPTLSPDQRLALLTTMGAGEIYVPDDLVARLIDGDAEVYRQLLAEPKATRLHLAGLVGRPSESWATLAVAALDAGYASEEVASAAEGSVCAFSGEASAYWEEWRRDWEKLLEELDHRVRDVARRGIDAATRRRDESLRKEENERIYGA